MKPAVFRFRFSLRPIDEIEPWGHDGRRRLSWFGLTDGWYWIEIDGQELFRGSDARPETPPYVEYQVVRLGEDILTIAPDVLCDVPADIAAYLRDPDGWLAAVDRIQADEKLDDGLVENGLSWWHARSLDSGHLVAAPRLWLWRTGESLNALWRPSAQPAAGKLWRPVGGLASQTVESFVAEIRRFDREFLDAMGNRVDALVSSSGRKGVDIDLVALRREQRDRSTWLEHALTKPRLAYHWDDARRLLEFSHRADLIRPANAD